MSHLILFLCRLSVGNSRVLERAGWLRCWLKVTGLKNAKMGCVMGEDVEADGETSHFFICPDFIVNLRLVSVFFMHAARVTPQDVRCSGTLCSHL